MRKVVASTIFLLFSGYICFASTQPYKDFFYIVNQLINKPENTEISYIREGKKYVHNKGSANINIQTHSGDIIIR